MKKWLPFFRRRWFIQLPLLLSLAVFFLHGLGVYRLPILPKLDTWIYDARLISNAPRTLNPQVVIVDVDEASLAAYGRWPWSRSTMAELVNQLARQQKVAALGFDMVMAEYENAAEDLAFASALANQPVVLGFYFTSDRSAHTSGQLPAPVMRSEQLAGVDFPITTWSGYAANVSLLTQAAPHAGFVNAISDADGVIRSVPLLAEFQGQYFEALSLALFRRYLASQSQSHVLPPLAFGIPTSGSLQPDTPLDHLLVNYAPNTSIIRVDRQVAMLVPYRGLGGPAGGSFTYVSAKDVLRGQLAPEQLKGKIVLVGSSTPTLSDLRATPMSSTYPGVEVHANLIAGMIAGQSPHLPSYAQGFELLQLVVLIIVMGLLLPRLKALYAVTLTISLCIALGLLHQYLHIKMGLVLPLASSVALCLVSFVAHVSTGFFQESLRRQQLVELFGNYVSPAWVQHMVRNNTDYSMKASNEVLTVMFCDMRGFTRLAGQMPPQELQALLNDLFDRLSTVIQKHGGTIDKYMGDCVMAFWGAPIAQHDHAVRAVACAQELLAQLDAFNSARTKTDLPIQMGIGINTGQMCVGDMGSRIRRSYTVIGDAVNLAARLEALCKTYSVSLIVGEATKTAVAEQQTDAQATSLNPNWIDLGSATISGIDQPVPIYTL